MNPFGRRYGMDPIGPPYPLVEAWIHDGRLVAALKRGRGPVLEIPVLESTKPQAAWDGVPLGELHAPAMARSIEHGRPVLNGYSGYWPDGFLCRMELAARLPSPEALAALVEETHLQQVVVRLDELGEAERRSWLEIAAAGGAPGLRAPARYGDFLLFDVRPEDLADVGEPPPCELPAWTRTVRARRAADSAR